VHGFLRLPHQQKRFMDCWMLWTPDKAGVPALPPPSVKQLIPKGEHEFTNEERCKNLEWFSGAMKGSTAKFEMQAKQQREQDCLERQKARERMRERKRAFKAQAETLMKRYGTQPEEKA
jgi:hypothetical protein